MLEAQVVLDSTLSMFTQIHMLGLSATQTGELSFQGRNLNLLSHSRIGDELMMNLLLQTNIFLLWADGCYQVCGVPIYNTKPKDGRPIKKESCFREKSKLPGPFTTNRISQGRINFVRSRMFYAQPALNKKSEVRFGLRYYRKLFLREVAYSDVLNRNKTLSHENICHILKYIFPRQYNLHNAFTSVVNKRETVQPFKDYSIREAEIRSRKRKCVEMRDTADEIENEPIPKRLRRAHVLVGGLFKRHHHCPYRLLLDCYCPVGQTASSPIVTSLDTTEPSSDYKTQGTPNSALSKQSISVSNDLVNNFTQEKEKQTFLSYATDTNQVCAFVNSVMRRIFSDAWFGSKYNRRQLMSHVFRFIRLRRFEKMSLHEVRDRMKTNEIEWTVLKLSERNCLSSSNKRNEIFSEFMYWVFDSFLTPLLSANFFITESSVYRNKVFYFRQDLWKTLCEPHFAHLKSNVLTQISTVIRTLVDLILGRCSEAHGAISAWSFLCTLSSKRKWRSSNHQLKETATSA